MKSGYALLLSAMLALPTPSHAAGQADNAIWSEPLDPIIVTATHSATTHGEAVAEGVQNIIDTEPLPMNLRSQKPVIAIVIDDMGLDRTRNPKVLNLPKEVTLAYLPYSPNIRWQASQALNAGHELLLHMPMEPERKTANPGPNYLGANMNPLELQSRLEKNLTAFSGYVGINNHMGSKLTCSRDALAVIMAALKERGLSFLDSRTGDCATAETVARENGVKTTHRDIFIDHSHSLAAASHALAATEAAARRTGSAIAIGHPKDNTIAALAKWLPTLEAKGFQLVPVSQVIQLRDWRSKPPLLNAAAPPRKPAPKLVAASLPEPVPAIAPAPEPIPLAVAAKEEEQRDTATLPVIPVLAHVSVAEMAVKVPVAVVAPPPMAAPIQIADIPVPVPAAQPEEPAITLIENMDDNGNIIAPPDFKPSSRIAGLSYKTDAKPVVDIEDEIVVEHETPVAAAGLVSSPSISGLSYQSDIKPVPVAEPVAVAEQGTAALAPSPRITGLSYKTDAKSLNN